VLIVGGGAGSSALSSAEVFNPRTNTFSSAGIGAMGSARYAPAAAPLPDGRVLVAGGYNGSSFISSAEVFAATNAFTFAVKGKTVIVSVQASGAVSVSDTASPVSVSASKKKKRKPLLKQSSGAGDPPTITVSLRLSKLAQQKLRRKGVTVNARITFAPQGGLASIQTAKLKIRGKKEKRKK
jgi:Kelch motif